MPATTPSGKPELEENEAVDGVLVETFIGPFVVFFVGLAIGPFVGLMIRSLVGLVVGLFVACVNVEFGVGKAVETGDKLLLCVVP